MEFINSLITPQSYENITLLQYLTMIILFMYLPFLSIVFGGSLLSMFYRRKGDEQSVRFAREIAEITTINKTSGVFIGLLPALALIMMFAQTLKDINVASVRFLIFSMLAIVIGLILIYVYRYSISFSHFYKKIKKNESEFELDQDVKEDYELISARMPELAQKSNRWAFVLLLVGSYFLIAALSVVSQKGSWQESNGFFYIFYSGSVFIRWVGFFISSITFAGAFLFFTYFWWEGGKKDRPEEFMNFVRERLLKIIITSAMFLPLFVLFSVLLLPAESLSSSVFIFLLIGLICLFTLYHFVYEMMKLNTVAYAGWVFIILLFASVSFIIADQQTRTTATKHNTALLNQEYVTHISELRGESGETEEASGEQIYSIICAACHKFDQKVVGPPYKETLPKYEGKMDELVDFILNPRKINPDYPPMPSQGLKPNEARAVAEYILNKYQSE